MLPLGLVLIGVGAIVLALGIVTTSDNGGDPATMLGLELGATTIFLLGTFAGLAVVVGLWLSKIGTRQGLKRRRETKELSKLKKKDRATPRRDLPPPETGPTGAQADPENGPRNGGASGPP